MDSSCSNFIDIFEIYRRYCDIRSEKENQNTREALAQLLKLVEIRGESSSLLNDIYKLMSYSDLTVDSVRFASFYDFVFFICREKGQKNITVEKAIEAWKIVLKGRFRLLNEWCTFVQKHQRHNISEDTWQQVLAFSRCVHEDLEGYDPKGAWPVLIDDFVDHMHRITISNKCSTRISRCNSKDYEAWAHSSNDSFPGIKLNPGSKRKPEAELSNSYSSAEFVMYSKRNRPIEVTDRRVHWELEHRRDTSEDQMEIVKHGGLMGLSKSSACAVEGSLVEGFAGLFSSGCCSPLDQKTRSKTNCFQPH